MSRPVVIPRHPRSCPGCVGSGSCWVCLGKGTVRHAVDVRRCHRCAGTGLCAEQRAETSGVPEQREAV